MNVRITIIIIAISIFALITYQTKRRILIDTVDVMDKIINVLDPDSKYEYLPLMPQQAIIIYKFSDLYYYNAMHYQRIMETLDKMGYYVYHDKKPLLNDIEDIREQIKQLKYSIPTEKLDRYHQFKELMMSIPN